MSPECRRATSSPRCCARRVLGDDRVEVEVLGVDQPRAVGRMREHLVGDERAGVEHDRRGRDQPLRAQRDEVGRARPGADEVDRHGTRSSHCVIAIAGRQPVRPPSGSACAIASRVSRPPCSACARARIVSPSTVTTFATRRPPGASSPRQRASRSAPVSPPPTKIASGRSPSSSNASGAEPLDDPQRRHAERQRVAGDPLRARLVALDRDRARARRRAQPLDRDRAAAGADVPQQLPGDRARAPPASRRGRRAW